MASPSYSVTGVPDRQEKPTVPWRFVPGNIYSSNPECAHHRFLYMYTVMYTLEMKKLYSVGSARANLPAILDDVQSGRVIQVTRRGQPVAVIMSPAEYATLERRQSTFGEACAEFRERFGVQDLGLDRRFFRALRDPKPGRKVRL